MPTARALVEMDTTNFEAAERRLHAGLASLSNAFVVKLAGATAIATKGLDLVVSAAEHVATEMLHIFKDIISDAQNLETLKVSFIPLLGSAQAADERIRLLEDTIANANFSMPEAAEASRQLELFGHGALDTKKYLSLLMDTSAATGMGLGSLGMMVGRMYDAMQNGLPINRFIRPLFTAGVVSGAAMKEINNLNGVLDAGTKQWAILEHQLHRWDGAAANSAMTTKGLWQQIKNVLEPRLSVDIGGPINEAIKPILKDIKKFLQESEGLAKNIGKFLGESIQVGYTAFKQGKLGELAGLTLEVGFKKALDVLYQGIVKIMPVIASLFGNIVSGIIVVLTSGSFWKAVGNALTGLGDILAAALMKGFKGPIQWLQDQVQWITENLATLVNATAKAGPGFAKGIATGNLWAAGSALAGVVTGQAPRSFADIQKENRDKELQIGVEPKTGKEYLADAGVRAKEVAEQMAQAIKAAIGEVTGGKGFGGTEAQAKLTELINSLSHSLGTQFKTPKSKVTAGTEGDEVDIEKGSRLGGVSSLRKVGGGGGIEMVSFTTLVNLQEKANEKLERIAVATEKGSTAVLG